MKLSCALLATWLVLPGGLRGDASPEDVLRLDQFTQIRVSDGLPSRRVMAIEQDAQGFVWLATQSGLVRYDGYEMKLFTHDEQDPDSLPDNSLYRLAIDGEDRLWIGTLSGRLAFYDPATERFRSWNLSRSRVPLSVAGDGVVRAGAGSRVLRIDANLEPIEEWSADDPEAQVQGVVEDADGRLWIAVFGSGVYRYDPANGENLFLPLPDPFDVFDMYFDGDFVWIATLAQGLFRIESDVDAERIAERPWRRFRHDPQDPDSISSDLVCALLRQSETTFWISTNRGIDLIDREGRRIRSHLHDPSNPSSLINNFAISLFRDRDGALWIGTDGGVSRTDPGRRAFARYGAAGFGPASDLPQGNILGIAEDSQGRLWLASSSGELARIDRESGEVLRIDRPDGSGAIWAMIRDRRGKIWLGSDQGLERYDPQAGVFERFAPDDPSLHFLGVSELFEDQDGRIWIGTSTGPRRFDPRDGRFEHPAPEITGRVLAFEQARDGSMWIGLDPEGVVRLLPDGSIRAWRAVGEPGDLRHGVVPDLHEASDGTLWASTVGGGLHRFVPEIDGFNHLGRRNGLPSDTTAAILEDDDGRLWISASTHLVRYDPKTQEIRSFDERDGLSAGLINDPGFRSTTGELFFGGVDGFVAVKPDQIRSESTPPPIVLTGFRLFNQPITARTPDSPLTSGFPHPGEIVLDHRQNFFAFEFAALSYGDPLKSRYAYRLEGLREADWIETDATRRFAQFSRLPPGEYTFRVVAGDRDAAWNREGATAAITVLPAPWRTWQAISAYVLLAIALLLFGFLRFRRNLRFEQSMNRQLRRRDRLLEQAGRDVAFKNAEILRFAYTLSHDLRNPLHTIQAYSSLAVEKAQQISPELATDLKRVHEAGRRMDELFDDLLDIAEVGGAPFKPQRVELLEMVQTATDRLYGKIGQTDLTIRRSLPTVYGDPWRIAEIFYHLLDNTIKFRDPSRRSRVEISAESQNGLARIRLHDNGRGIAPPYREKVFELFSQLDPRIEGNGCGLALVRRIVESHGGTIRVLHSQPPGATFEFTLPLRPENLPETEETMLDEVVGLEKLLG